MNVIISNKYNSALQNLGIDIMSSDVGVFSVDDIISKYRNFFFQRMILDITALKDYQDIKNIQKLSISLDMDKLILLLDDSEQTSNPEFLSQLISLGIYNFTKNIEGVMYLYDNPNVYRDVAQYHLLNNTPSVEPTIVSTQEINSIRILGVKNVTKQAGATSLVYMMYKKLKEFYSVVAIEVDKSDFVYYNNQELISTSSANFTSVLNKYTNKEVVLIDINDSAVALSSTQDVLYLVEPSLLKLNKLMMVNPNALSNLKNKKVLLNKSFLSSKDVIEFEYESRSKIYYNLPCLDDRDSILEPLTQLLIKLGFTRLGSISKKKGLF